MQPIAKIPVINGFYMHPINDDGTIDFSDLDYLPTRESLENAWETLTEGQRKQIIDEAFLEAQNYVEPEPIPEWDLWQMAMLKDESFYSVLASFTPQSSALFSMFGNYLTQLNTNPQVIEQLKIVWGMFQRSLTLKAETKEKWAAIATQYSLPKEFIDVIKF